MLIALSILAIIIFTPIVLLILIGIIFSLFNCGQNFNLLVVCLVAGMWVSPIRIFSYPNRNIDARELLLSFINLRKAGISIDIEKLEKVSLEGINMKKFAILLIMFAKYEIDEYKKNSFDYAQKIIPFYRYEEDNIFDFYEKPYKMYFTDILSDKIEDKNLRMYIEFSSDSDFETVIEKTLQGFALQGTLKADISKLLPQYDIKETAIEKIMENKEDVVDYLNQNIDKEKYAFDIDTLSVGIVNLNEVVELLNKKIKEQKNQYDFDISYSTSDIRPSDIHHYLFFKEAEQILESEE